MSLREVQALFHGVLTGEIPSADPRVANAFVGDPKLPAKDRLEIYAGMYLARQVEALQLEFPMVFALLGECAFADLAGAYLKVHPSEHPDIGQLGRHLATFIRGHAGVRGDLAELAELERARSLAFATPDLEPVSWDALASLGPEGFAEASLRLSPSLRPMTASHDLASLWKALQQGEQPAPSLLDAPATLAIWKQGFEVFHAALATPEAEALKLALQGAKLGEVCEAFANEADPATAAFTALASWFNEGWVAEVKPG